jgi:VWFA-related protein
LVYNAPGTNYRRPARSPRHPVSCCRSRSLFSEPSGRANVRSTFIYHGKSFCALTVFFVFVVSSAVLAQENPAPAEPQATASSRIDLAAIGFHEPSRMDRTLERQPSESLNFVDANHLLLTFNRKALMKRLPECTPDHEDRLMHAVILELPGGNVVKEADWFLHDRRRYLWPMGPGKFLLRRWNNLYVVDSSLSERLLLHSPKNLLWVSVTPDGSQIILETENDKKPASNSKSSSKSQPKYVVKFVDVKTLTPQRTLLFNNLTNLDGTSSGYADVIRKGDIWLLRFGPTITKRRNLARVRSQTVPVVMYPTENSLLIGRCATAGCNYGVTAFTLTGHRLWRQHWRGLRSYPEIIRSDDNSRFSVSSLRVEPDSTPPLEDSPDDPFQIPVSERDVFRQEIQVFDTASGNSVLSVRVSPAVVTGQNVSLSPDGSRLALLRSSKLELFDLPPLSADEQSKFAALKADVPGLYSFGSEIDYDTAINTVSAASPEDEENMTADAPAGSESDEASKSKSSSPADASGKLSSQETSAATPAADTAEKSSQPENPPVTTFKVTTKAVVVDVVVTDSKGHPVRGLSQQDFQLTEDNNAQSIRYFREFNDKEDSLAPSTSESAPVTQSASATSGASAAPAASSPNIFDNRANPNQSGAVTLVLFDTLNTPPQDQSYALQQLIKFLQSKPKVSEFALCTLNSGEYPLRLIQGFTTDENLLLSAVKSKKGHPRNNRWQGEQAEAQNSVTTVSALTQEGRTSGFQNLASTLQGMQAEQFVTDTSERAARTIDAMMLLARYLSGISGRKNIVWLSSSFPIAISLGPLFHDPQVENPNYTYKIKRATNLLADAQVAVYPVDVRGLQVFTASLGGGAGVGGPRSFQPPDPTNPNATQVPNGIPQGTSFANDAAEQDTLIQFAVATGGKAFFNTNDIRDAIATANEQGSNYYSLSYTSTNKVYDGKFRTIKVHLAQKGFKLAYRQGYFADEVNAATKEAQLARNAIATAMHFGSPPAREIQFSVRVYPVGGKKKVDRTTIGEIRRPLKRKEVFPPQIEVQHYVIDYTLNGSELRFVATRNGGFFNSLALMISSFGSEGRMLTGMSTLARSDVAAEVYKKIANGDVGFQEEVDVPLEARSMRLGLQDQMANHLGTVDVPLPVPVDPTTPKVARNRLPEIEPD